MAEYSPWGPIQHRETINEAVRWVSTARHGGVQVDKAYAQQFLSGEAIEAAIKEKEHIYFEEDCDWAIVPWELKTLHHKFFSHREDSVEEQRAELKKSIIRWNTEYAFRTGVIEPDDPLPEKYICRGKGNHFTEDYSLMRDGASVFCSCGYIMLSVEDSTEENEE